MLACASIGITLDLFKSRHVVDHRQLIMLELDVACLVSRHVFNEIWLTDYFCDTIDP